MRSIEPPRAAIVPVARLAAVDGLRGVACLAVVAHHCYFAAGRYQWPAGLPRILSYGYLGVEVFFVLSGFCLAYPLIGRPIAEIDWILYAKRRVRRIVPAFWASLLLLLGASVVIARFQLSPFHQQHLLLVPTTRQFFLVATFIAVWFNPVFWTLTVEARWYFLLPLFVMASRRLGSVALLLICFCVSLAFSQIEPALSGRMRLLCGPLPLYLPLFASGVAAAAFLRTRRVPHVFWVNANRVAIVLALLLVAYFAPAHPDAEFRVSRIAPGGILAITLLLSALYDPVARRILSSKLLTVIGIISYSLYLIHLPIVQFSYAITAQLNWPAWAQVFFYEGLILPACILAAYGFYVCFERPFLQMAPSRRTAVATLHPNNPSGVVASVASRQN